MVLDLRELLLNGLGPATHCRVHIQLPASSAFSDVGIVGGDGDVGAYSKLKKVDAGTSNVVECFFVSISPNPQDEKSPACAGPLAERFAGFRVDQWRTIDLDGR